MSNLTWLFALAVESKDVIKDFCQLRRDDPYQTGDYHLRLGRIAYINGFIGKEKLLESAKIYGKSPYGSI